MSIDFTYHLWYNIDSEKHIKLKEEQHNEQHRIDKQMAEELATEIESIQDAIKAVMTAQNTDEIIVDVFKIRWKSVISSRFDSASFKITHKELYEQYTKATESKRFTIA